MIISELFFNEELFCDPELVMCLFSTANEGSEFPEPLHNVTTHGHMIHVW